MKNVRYGSLARDKLIVTLEMLERNISHLKCNLSSTPIRRTALLSFWRLKSCWLFLPNTRQHESTSWISQRDTPPSKRHSPRDATGHNPQTVCDCECASMEKPRKSQFNEPVNVTIM